MLVAGSPKHSGLSALSRLPEGSPVGCLNWTCLARVQEQAGTGKCGCFLLALGTDLARGSHGLWFLGLVCMGGAWCQVLASSLAQSRNLMESGLLSALPEILCMPLALWELCGISDQHHHYVILGSAAAWSETLGLLKLVIVPRLIQAPHMCQHEPSVCRTQHSAAIRPCCRQQGPWVSSTSSRKDFSLLRKYLPRSGCILVKTHHILCAPGARVTHGSVPTGHHPPLAQHAASTLPSGRK